MMSQVITYGGVELEVDKMFEFIRKQIFDNDGRYLYTRTTLVFVTKEDDGVANEV